jgi:TldD protein
MRRAAERALEASRSYTAATSTDVGRYDLVLGAKAVARLLTMTLAQALNLERALGYEANRAGTSFAAPPAEILGKYQVGSSLLTLTADRTRPHAPATVGWDDEGVPTGEHTLIRDGVIVDYLTTRQTAAELSGVYQSRGSAPGSRGCASGGGQALPSVRLPNLALAPGKESTTLEELIAGTKRGFYVENCGGSSDQQLLSTQAGAGASSVREIRNGKLGRAIGDFAFQFITPSFWKSVDAIGGAASVMETQAGTGHSGLDPLQLPSALVRVVPVRVREVNVLNTGRTA